MAYLNYLDETVIPGLVEFVNKYIGDGQDFHRYFAELTESEIAAEKMMHNIYEKVVALRDRISIEDFAKFSIIFIENAQWSREEFIDYLINSADLSEEEVETLLNKMVDIYKKEMGSSHVFVK